jgi:hypothetical protein
MDLLCSSGRISYEFSKSGHVTAEKVGFFSVAEVYGKQLHWILTFLFSEFKKKKNAGRGLTIF